MKDTKQAAEGIEKLDVTAVNSEESRKLYKARENIYPKLVQGKWRAIKWGVLFLTLGIYYLLPWIRWERGPNEPNQAVLVDFEGSRFYFFFIEIWPDELYYVTGLLIVAALVLFLVSALFGRLWCGFTCPQTVWTDLYIAVERFIEGDRNARIRLDKSKWGFEKATKKLSKHFIWLLIAMATGGAWVFYFHDAPTVFGQIFDGTAPGSAYLFIGILTFTTYFLAGWMREQVCTYMCPWPRIQAALIDEHSVQVTYKRDRGEPRGPHKKDTTWDGRGDCIDCNQCVAACPMGIDIRDGAQLECINCALCIDACDDIMAKIGRPKSLIGYDTDHNMELREAGGTGAFQFLRTRTILYGAVTALVCGIMLYTLLGRSTVLLNTERDRAPPYVTLADGSVRNAYTVKILNKANDIRAFNLVVEGPQDLELRTIQDQDVVTGNTVSVQVAGDKVRPIRLFITVPEGSLGATSERVVFTVIDTQTNEKAVSPSVFLTGRRD